MIQLRAKNLFKTAKLAFLGLVLMVGFVTVVPNSAQAASKIYVDPSYQGEETGESAKPYTDLQKAIDKADKKNKEVILRPGTYKTKETIRVWPGVTVNGLDRDKVVIDGTKKKTVIKLYHKSALEHVTVRGGKRGIDVREHAKATIWECKIIDNKKDGIRIKEADVRDQRKVRVLKTIITDNGWNGIYSEKRKFYLEDNEIYDNEGDGIEFASGSHGTIKNTRIKDNEGVGIKLFVDNSKIGIKNCTIRDNDKSGIEVRSNGGDGWISLNRKTKLYKNDKYGIVRINVGQNYGQNYWDNKLKIDSGVQFWDNDNGPVSHKIVV
jgi:hypothetical protein